MYIYENYVLPTIVELYPIVNFLTIVLFHVITFDCMKKEKLINFKK